MTARSCVHRVGAVAVVTLLTIATAGVASASQEDDLAVAMAGVERGLEAAQHQTGAGPDEARLVEAAAAVQTLVDERLRADPDLDTDDVLASLVEKVPAGLDGDLGGLLDEVKATGQELAEQKRADAPGQTGTGGNGNAGGKGNAGGNGKGSPEG